MYKFTFYSNKYIFVTSFKYQQKNFITNSAHNNENII